VGVAEEDNGIAMVLENGEDFPVGRKLEVHEGVVLKTGDGPGRTSLDGLFVQILDAVD
jgi:hypothetical protein